MLGRTVAMVSMLAAGVAVAADGTLQGAQRCAQVQDSLQRLVCYDRLFPPGQGPAAPAAAAPVVPARAPAVPAPVPAPTVTAEFGADSVRRSDEQREAEAPPRSLTAAVKSVRETRPNVYRMTLENGQVWDQMDMDITFTVDAGDTVQIERGRMGGYRMSRTNRGGSGWVRVNRLK